MWEHWDLISLGFLPDINQKETMNFFYDVRLFSQEGRFKWKRENVAYLHTASQSLVARIQFVFILLFLCSLNLTVEKSGAYPLSDREC